MRLILIKCMGGLWHEEMGNMKLTLGKAVEVKRKNKKAKKQRFWTGKIHTEHTNSFEQALRENVRSIRQETSKKNGKRPSKRRWKANIFVKEFLMKQAGQEILDNQTTLDNNNHIEENQNDVDEME